MAEKEQPLPAAVYENYPNLATQYGSLLERTGNRWIEEGAHGWVDEFKVAIAK